MSEKIMIADMYHSTPRVVALQNVEDELIALPKENAPANAPPSASLRACTLTLVVLCDRHQDPAALESLIAEVVSANPARVIVIAHHDPNAEAALETYVSVYEQGSSGARRLVGEEIAIYPRGAMYDSLASVVLGLRVSGLPLILFWRGQPELDDSLFHALVGECDEIILDSQHFTARAERVNSTMTRVRVEYPEVPFGDINWHRIRPWREFVAQFFDDPAHLTFLDSIVNVKIEFSVGMNGNQSAAVLLMAWLASLLKWRVVNGSYKRDGYTRRARFECGTADAGNLREIQIEIKVREQEDCQPGELTGVRLETTGEPPTAIFAADRAVGGFVYVRELTPSRFSERCLVLNIPMDSNVISSELDTPGRDRNYHRALALLDALVTPMVESRE